jgi:hypothetical protein
LRSASSSARASAPSVLLRRLGVVLDAIRFDRVNDGYGVPRFSPVRG